MTARRWRGTIVYAGTLAALGAAALARFGVPVADPGTLTSATGSGVADPATGSTSPGSTSSGSASPSDTSTGSADTSTVTVTGDVAQTPYGPVQVAVTFSGTHIDDVVTVQSPTGPESSQIAARSTPVLAQEVVDAQSAQIDTVSGATYTSEGYRESVQSAIDARG
ncbi:FMN-binding protein [Isoptericola sp. NPDC057191]|uniref:FMN-binding protein n=1 Tax=Isoptericola sp. NPDC057191 TaxID=3346041 RepID=UPI00363CC6B8